MHFIVSRKRALSTASSAEMASSIQLKKKNLLKALGSQDTDSYFLKD